jgi:hypothetical protein
MLQNSPDDLTYSLKRAGPKNFNQFFVKNYLGRNLTEFNFASYPIRNVYSLPIDDITSLEIHGENSDEGSFL